MFLTPPLYVIQMTTQYSGGPSYKSSSQHILRLPLTVSIWINIIKYKLVLLDYPYASLDSSRGRIPLGFLSQTDTSIFRTFSLLHAHESHRKENTLYSL